MPSDTTVAELDLDLDRTWDVDPLSICEDFGTCHICS